MDNPTNSVRENVALARTVMEAGNVSGDWQPLIEHLADDAVFKVTVPEGTPISEEIVGKQAVMDHLIHLGTMLGFIQERPLEYFGGTDRVVILGQETVEVKKSGATAPGSEYATVLDIRDGRITRILVIQDMSAFAEAYRTT